MADLGDESVLDPISPEARETAAIDDHAATDHAIVSGAIVSSCLAEA